MLAGVGACFTGCSSGDAVKASKEIAKVVVKRLPWLGPAITAVGGP